MIEWSVMKMSMFCLAIVQKVLFTLNRPTLARLWVKKFEKWFRSMIRSNDLWVYWEIPVIGYSKGSIWINLLLLLFTNIEKMLTLISLAFRWVMASFETKKSNIESASKLSTRSGKDLLKTLSNKSLSRKTRLVSMNTNWGDIINDWIWK